MVSHNHSRRAILSRLTMAGLGGVMRAGYAASQVPLPAGQLQAGANYSAERKGYGFLVMQHGRVIHESYANGAKRSDMRRIYSGTKGFWGLAALAAVEDGVLSLNEPVAETIHEWRADSAKAAIKVRQLLDFTCGLERCLRLHGEGLKDRNAMAIARPLVARPGSSFVYGPAALQVFHELLKRKLGASKRKESPTAYLERRVLRPMGLGTQRYLADQSGNPLLAAGFVMTVQQWSKIGQCLVREGQPILNTESFANIREGSSANAAYNFGFWNNRAAGKLGAREIDIEDMLDVDWFKQNWSRACICRDAPPDMLACIGSGYQRLFAIPSMGLVAVRQGQNARFSDGAFLRLMLGKS